ncbi:type VI secretion system lipoprotein TssJ [Desulfovibrio sp. OttesenSCG-928-M14]|nr:type VI secretion system lipoprotein TssJ [Desulfovibrio sp. OttesenSCG-928-M14]
MARLALFALAVALPLAACSSTQPKASLESEDPDLVLWPDEEKAVRLQFKSDRDLNLYDSKPHSIQVCVYQLDDKKAFLEQSKTPEGIATLLKAEAFDKSVKSVTRLFIQPLEDAVFELDRAEDATFVGIVSGYFDSTPANSAKLWQIKLKETRSGHLFWASTIYSAGTLELALRLTAKAMTGTVIPPKEQ